MFCTRRIGAFSLALQLLKSASRLSLSSPYSTNPKPNNVTLSSLTSPALKSPGATNPALICSLLSNSDTQTPNLDLLLKDFVQDLDSALVLQVLTNYKQLGRLKTLEFFSWAGQKMGFRFDDSVVEYMVDFLGRRKLYDDMKCFLLTLYSLQRKVSSRAFSICIRFLGRNGRIREALCLFREMETKFGCKPDNFAWNNILYVLCKKGNDEELIDVALETFRMIESPDMYSISNILIGLCKYGRLETAVEVFREMCWDGLVPTRSAVNVLIGELCSCSAKEGAIEKVRVNSVRRPFTILVPNVSARNGAIYPAIEVFSAVCDTSSLPSVFVIRKLMSELCRLGKFKEAVDVLGVAEQRKLTCVEECYTVIIQSLCENRLIEEVGHLFKRMFSGGLKPTLAIYNCIICMLCKMGSLGDAERVFQIMNKNRCLPNSVTYTALIHAYVEANSWQAAYDLLFDMLGMGLAPHHNTYSLVDRILKENGQMDMSINLEKKLDSQILYKHCKEGRLDAAYEKLQSMLEKGFQPPVYVRDTIERAFRKCDRLSKAHELLDKMKNLKK